MSLSSAFQRPLLIYDDRCYSCARFARAASVLSRSWIRVAGHHYSQEAREAKQAIFPPGYDSTRMFWLVNKDGAYGARSGLPQVAREIIVGLFRKRQVSEITAACEYNASMSCYTPTNVFRRLARMLSHGAKFAFE